jgi:transcriptional regulator with XRE-family HTH domain
MCAEWTALATTLRDPRYRAIVAKLIAARKADGLNQRDVAERLGKTQSYVAKVELHERRLDVVQLVEWLRALEIEERKFLVEMLKDIPPTKKRR